MVELQKVAIQLLQETAINGIHSEIMKCAIDSLPTLRNNLNQVLVCQRDCDNSNKQFK